MSAQLVEDDQIEEYRRQRKLMLDSAKRQRYATTPPKPLTPADATRQRIQELVDVGWTLDAIAAMNGTGTPQGLRAILRGRTTKVRAEFAAIADLPITVAPPEHLPDTMWVPVLGATRRVQALMRLGYPGSVLNGIIGHRAHTFAGAYFNRTPAGHWRAVDAAYDQLTGEPGPSQASADRAKARGWAPPLAWNDIDDPFEVPRGDRAFCGVDEILVAHVLAGDWTAPTTKAEKVEIVARWRAEERGPLAELERLTGWNISRYYTPEPEGPSPAPEPLPASTGLEEVPAAVVRAAGITTAAAACAGGWTEDLEQVLDVIGIRSQA